MNLTKSLRKPFLVTVATLAVACGGGGGHTEEPHDNPPAPTGTPSAVPSAAPAVTPAATPAK